MQAYITKNSMSLVNDNLLLSAENFVIACFFN